MTLTADHTAAEITDTGTYGTDEVRFTSTTATTLTLYSGDTGVESVVIGTGTAASAITTGTIALNVNATLVTNALTITGNAGANSLTGTAFADTLIGGAGADNLNGGKGQDSITGGAGSDTFIFAAGDDGITATTLDKILDYAKGAVGTGDLIDYSATLTKGGNATTATASQASINQTNCIATFASGSGTTLADAIGDIAARFTAATDTAGEFAFFKINNTGDYYLFVSDGTAGAGVNDDVIQLVGINSIGAIDLTGGNLTIMS
jgi:Ca2+-binding RTX toxin-like protein